MPFLAPTPRSAYKSALYVVTDIADHLEAEQRRRNLTTPAMAAQIGISYNTLYALLGGRNPSTATLLRCLRWLAKPTP